MKEGAGGNREEACWEKREQTVSSSRTTAQEGRLRGIESRGRTGKVRKCLEWRDSQN